MGRKYQVISGDGHVETPPHTWSKYVPDKYSDRAPRLVNLPEGGQGWIIEGQPLIHNGKNLTAGGSISFKNKSYFKEDGSPVTGAGDGAQRLREQDSDGIDAEVLFPPIYATQAVETISDKAAYRSIIHAYNTFLAEDYCSVAPDRLIGNGAIPVSGIDDAVAELKAIHSLGLRSVSFYQFPSGKGTHSKEDDRFWETALALGIRLSPHMVFGDRMPRASGATPGAALTPSDALGAEIQRSSGDHRPVYCMVQLIVSGVLDRFPEIQFYFAETNASWLPWTMSHLDHQYWRFKDVFGVTLEMAPSEYIRKHFRFGFVDDPLAIEFRNVIPMELLMWGSDFPHAASTYPNSTASLDKTFAGVEESVKRKVLLENPAEFFGLDLTADITETPV